jgi:hypothetical protein
LCFSLISEYCFIKGVSSCMSVIVRPNPHDLIYLIGSDHQLFNNIGE